MVALALSTSASPSPIAVPALGKRLRSAFRALAVLARDPGRLDQVLVFAQAVNAATIARRGAELLATEEGRRLFAECPRIDRAHVDFDALRALPDGTLGREYTRFLDDNAIGPEPFEALPDVGDERAALMMLRVRQTHDLWHVLTGYAPDIRGEVLLQAFTYAQLGAPSALLIAILGSLRGGHVGPQHVRDLRRAYRRGRATRALAAFRWEDHWATPVATLREMLRCPA